MCATAVAAVSAAATAADKYNNDIDAYYYL